MSVAATGVKTIFSHMAHAHSTDHDHIGLSMVVWVRVRVGVRVTREVFIVSDSGSKLG